MNILTALVNFLKGIVEFIYYFFIIMFALIIIWILKTFGYPRLHLTGHTEKKFESWLDEFASTTIYYLKGLKKKNLSSELTTSIDNFFNQYKSQFLVDINTSDFSKVKFENTDFTPLLLMLMFFDSLKNQSDGQIRHAFDVFHEKSSSRVVNLIRKYYDPTTKNPTTFIAKDKFVGVCESFKSLRVAIAKESGKILRDIKSMTIKSKKTDFSIEEINLLMLDIMLNVYLSPLQGGSNYFEDLTFPEKRTTIERMFRTRITGGGPANSFALVWFYMEDYGYHLIFEKFLPLWKNYPVDAKRWWRNICDSIASKSVGLWIANLPAKFAGSKQVEHFGIDKIVMAAVSLAEVLVSIIEVIADPIAFIKFLIGAIFALVFYVFYIFLVLISEFTVGPVLGYVGRAIYNWWLTLFWFFIAIIYFIFYGLLAVIDIIFGGFIMRSLRCENMPDAWAKNSNFNRRNKYTRSLLCAFPCSKRYYPNGFFCTKQDAELPTYTPQQVIYKTWEKRMYISTIKDKLFFDTKPDTNYFVDMSQEDQKKVWANVYKTTVDYYSSTMEGNKYDPVIRGMCMCLIDKDPKETQINKMGNDTLKNLCQYTYCTSSNENLNSLPFCKDFTFDDEKKVSPAKKNVMKVFLFIMIAITFIFVLIILILYYKNVFTTELPLEIGLTERYRVFSIFSSGVMAAKKATGAVSSVLGQTTEVVNNFVEGMSGLAKTLKS